jgi:hypothetical protein
MRDITHVSDGGRRMADVREDSALVPSFYIRDPQSAIRNPPL